MVYVRKLWEIYERCGCKEMLSDFGVGMVMHQDRRQSSFKPDVDGWQMVRKEVVLAIRMFL